MNPTTDAERIQMRKDMVVVFDHYNLTPEARRVAKESAEKRVKKAAVCYRAIAHSLPRR
jgi:hypothetical protein